MSVEVRVPSVGESITEGILVQWEKASGDSVATDDPLFELETDKVTMTINAESGGVLEIIVAAGETVEVGQVVGRIGESPVTGESAPVPAPPPSDTSAETGEKKPAPEPQGFLSPAVRRLVAEHNLDPNQLTGTGKAGRLTKEDVLKHLAMAPAASATPSTPAKVAAVPVAPVATSPQATNRQTRKPLSSLRQRVAERLLQSQQNTATLTTFNEVDMSAVMNLRSRFKESFEKEHGVRLGFMSFFVKASVEALRTVPQFNSQIDGEEIVENHFYDIGIAVGSERGLVVPVVRDADQLSFAEIEAAISDFARRAGNKTLTLDDLTGGCFTVSNGGVYGSLMGTPILNPPQTGILGMHAIKKRPVAVGEEIKIRPMMYLALSYDHRVVDGKEAVTFLRRIVDCIEAPERLLLEI